MNTVKALPLLASIAVTLLVAGCKAEDAPGTATPPPVAASAAAKLPKMPGAVPIAASAPPVPDGKSLEAQVKAAEGDSGASR